MPGLYTNYYIILIYPENREKGIETWDSSELPHFLCWKCLPQARTPLTSKMYCMVFGRTACDNLRWIDGVGLSVGIRFEDHSSREKFRARGDGKILGEALASQAPTLMPYRRTDRCQEKQTASCLSTQGWNSRAVGRCCPTIGPRRPQEGATCLSQLVDWQTCKMYNLSANKRVFECFPQNDMVWHFLGKTASQDFSKNRHLWRRHCPTKQRHDTPTWKSHFSQHFFRNLERTQHMERSLSTYLSTHLPIYLSTYLPSHLAAYCICLVHPRTHSTFAVQMHTFEAIDETVEEALRRAGSVALCFHHNKTQHDGCAPALRN